MSQENVEVARRWLEAISGGSDDFDRALALVHRDIVFVPPGDQPPYRGAESVRRWMEPDAFQEQVVKTFEPVVGVDATSALTVRCRCVVATDIAGGGI